MSDSGIEPSALEQTAMARAIGDFIPAIVWSADTGGRLRYMNRAWTLLTGQSTDDAVGGGWSELVHPGDLDGNIAAWESAVLSGTPYQREVRVRAVSGEYRWLLNRAAPQRDERGEIVRWYGTILDVDDRRRAGAARDLFAALAENSTDFIAIAELEGRFVFVNEAGRALVGFGADEDLAPLSIFDVFAASESARVAAEIRPALERPGSWSGEVRFRTFGAARAGGVPVEAHLFVIRDDRGEPTALATVTVDRTERERIERRLQTLVAASTALTVSLDPATTIESAVRFVSDRFASYALLDVIDDAGVVERVAVAHSNPSRNALVEALRAFNPPADRVGTHPVARAIAYGEPSIETIDDAWIERASISQEHAAAMRALDMRMLLVVPVVGAARTIGALTCALDAHADRGPFDDGDVAFAAELGRRIGIAIENARLFERERHIAETLQAASLPKSLPSVPGLRLDAEYRPGNSEATVGGDWYDAFVLQDGRVVMTVGDVIGNGLRAAVTMAKLRQAMQGAAFVRPDPGLMLDVADRTLRLEDDTTYATALAAVYDPATRTLEFATAGHPRPLLVHRVRDAGAPHEPSIEVLSHAGMMLGLRRPGEDETKLVAMPLGTSIVFFTDGLLELTRDYDAGERRLAEAVMRPGLFERARPANSIAREILGTGPALDDVAILTATVVGVPPGAKVETFDPREGGTSW